MNIPCSINNSNECLLAHYLAICATKPPNWHVECTPTVARRGDGLAKLPDSLVHSNLHLPLCVEFRCSPICAMVITPKSSSIKARVQA